MKDLFALLTLFASLGRASAWQPGPPSPNQHAGSGPAWGPWPAPGSPTSSPSSSGVSKFPHKPSGYPSQSAWWPSKPSTSPGAPWPPSTGPHVHNSSFVPDHVLRVTYGNVSIACQTRPSVLVNGTIPGPALRLKPGRTSWIRVYNDMTEFNFTMHWHGLSQSAAPFSDGTPAASQWPVAPLHFFDYEVHPEISESGSYFYHSHVGFQAVSAAGPLVVEDVGAPPYAYDEERVVLFQDYFNRTDSSIEAGLVSPNFTWSGETNAVMINGVGVSIGETAGKGACKLPVINVDAGKTYRMRFVGGTALSMTQFAIDKHENFTIIAADGSYTLPHSETYMQVSPGQRFDVIFKAKSFSELGNQTDYLIQFETKDRPTIYYGYGVLRYNNATAQITTSPASPPRALSNATYDWLEYTLQPLYPNSFPTASEVTRRVEIYNHQLSTKTIIWRINGDQWNESSSPYPGDKPYLVNIYENGPSAIPNYTAAQLNKGWDPVSYTWPAKIGEVLEIVLYNTASSAGSGGGYDYHPFHAHGGHYYDIGSGNGTYDPVENEKKLAGYNPVFRDTTNLYRYEASTPLGGNVTIGWRAWRLRVQDAGTWMIHCHILAHMLMGMQMVWVMGDYEQIVKIPHYDAAGYLEYGGDAYGNETFAPTVVHYYDS